MINILKTFVISIIEAVLTIIILVLTILSGLNMMGIYIVYGVSAILLPLISIIVYHWRFKEKLLVVPLGFLFSALYSLGVALYSYYGTGWFSETFKDTLYFTYFLPSMVYCGISFIIYAIFVTASKKRKPIA